MGFFSKIKPLVEGIKAQQGPSVEVENDIKSMGDKARGDLGNGMVGRLVNAVTKSIATPTTNTESAVGKLGQQAKLVSAAKPQSVLNQIMDEEEDKKPIGMKKGGAVRKTKKYSSGGSVSSASKRGDGCAQRGKTKGKMV